MVTLVRDVVAVLAVLLLGLVLLLVRRLRAGAERQSRLLEEALSSQRARHGDLATRVAELEAARSSPLQGLLSRRLGALEAIAESIMRDLDQALAKGGEEIRHSALRAARRAERLARIAGGGRAREKHTTLAGIWPRVVALTAEKIRRGHSLKAEIPADLPPVSGSGESWAQILVALIDNAADAMASGGSIEVGAAATEFGEARVWVQDNGPGIKAEALPHVTEPFYTSHAAAGAEGLGLPMVAALIEGMGGRMGIASPPGRGTRVEMRVPFAEPARAAEPVLAMRLEGCFLIADDDADVRRTLGRTLRSFGAEVVEVDSGTAARTSLLSEPGRYRAAILDVVMPGTPVGDVVGTARARSSLPVLLVSGYDTMHMVDAALALGGVRFLRKPFTREELFHALDDLLSGSSHPEGE